uniref:PAK1 interacting protein 1 n=1 Tax=Corvus moneduloides TaxID=1196302 RepID=A0A8C3DIN8_CORMO
KSAGPGAGSLGPRPKRRRGLPAPRALREAGAPREGNGSNTPAYPTPPRSQYIGSRPFPPLAGPDPGHRFPPSLAIPALTPLGRPAAITASAASAPRGPPCAGCPARSLSPRRSLRRFPLRGGSHRILLTRRERALPGATRGASAERRRQRGGRAEEPAGAPGRRRAVADGAGGGVLRTGAAGVRHAARPGTITCLEFYGTAHLLSGAEDGLICIWNTKRWECLKSIKAHKTWNLVEGRSAFIKNLKQNAHIIKWSPDGEKYVTVITNKVDIYRLDTASITGTITTEKRISSLRFITDSILAIAGDDEMIRFYSCDSQKCLCEFKAHENRIKDIYSFEREGQHVIVTASSDGYIKMWNLDLDKIKDGPSLLCEVNTKARLTCLAVWLDRASEMKENSDKTATSSQETEDEKSSTARRNKDFWTSGRVKAAKRKRKIIPRKQKLEAPVQKKKKKQNSSA